MKNGILASLLAGLGAFGTVFGIACSSSTLLVSPHADAGAADGSSDADLDGSTDGATTPSTTYPVAHFPLPAFSYGGGPIIEHPKIVSVTFDSNTDRATLDAFGDTITTTAWWDAVRAGYCDAAGHCIGQGTSGGHGHLADIAATSFSDTADPAGSSTFRDFLMSAVAAGTLPAPDANTIYTVYLPANATISLDGSLLCTQLAAYHNYGIYTPSNDGGVADAGAGTQYQYAVIPTCGFDFPATSSASHEIIEAATDPSFTSYYMEDLAWYYDGVEVGDICVTHSPNDRWQDASVEDYQEGAYTVQRSWSMDAAAQSHDPCVPAPSAPYFNVAPSALGETINLQVGQQKTITLTAFSDAPVADFNVSAAEDAVLRGGTGVLAFTFDRTTANNGTTLSLTVQLKAKPATNPARYFVIAEGGGARHAWAMSVIGE